MTHNPTPPADQARFNAAADVRRRQLETELANLYQNLLAGLASPALQARISEREIEKARLATITRVAVERPSADILPHPALMDMFTQKVEALRTTLDDASVRSEASEILSTLIESVTIYPGGVRGPEAEVVAKVSDL